ncbi:hypothetical protein ACOMHN_055827 [Nucella lapillus]
MEQELDSTEIENRKNNLKLLGVEELGREDYEDSIDYIVDLLNESTRYNTWQFSDIEKTFRIGKYRQNSYHPRPLIVVFHRWADNMKVLQDPEIRNEFRRKNIKITSDLTPKQRKEIEYYRLQGKRAYYRNGKLQVDDRPLPSYQHEGDQRPQRHSEDQCRN